MKKNSFEKIPHGFLIKWQEIADLIASIMKIPAALIMKTESEFMEVFTSSKTENNPYKVGDKEHWHGLYCETVIKTQKKLSIPNALKDKTWDKNPDIKLGMIAYLGYPINFPDQTPFGTLCVLDSKERHFSAEHEKLLRQFKKVIELDLALIHSLELKEDYSHADIIQRLYQDKEELLTTNEALKKTKEVLHESEENLRTTLRSIGDAVISTDTDGLVVAMNLVAESLTGWSEKEAFGQPLETVFRIINEQTRQPVESPVTNVLKSGQIVGLANHTLLIDRNGRVIPIMDSGAPIRNDAGEITGVVLVFRDQTKEHLARKALQESEDRFQLLFNKAPLGYQSLDFDGNFIEVNQQWLDTLGYQREEVIGKWFGDFMTSKSKELVKERFQLFIAQGKVDTEFEMVHKNGSILFIAFNGKIGYDLKGDFKQTHCILQDITERNRAEQALQESEAKMRSIYSVAPTGIGVIADRVIREVNPRLCEMTGYTREQLLGKNVRMLYPSQEEYDFVGKEKYDQISKKGTGKVETCWQIKDGSIINILMASTPIDINDYSKGVTFTALDITEHKQALKAIAENEIQYRNLANSGSALIWTSGLDKLCNYFNDPWLKFTGRTIEQEMGNGWAEGVHPDDFDRCLETYVTAFDTREPFEMEYRLRHVSGEYKVILDMGTPNFNSMGEFVGYIGHCFDITERKFAEEELIKLSRAVEQSPVSILITDKNGSIEYINTKALTLTGYKIEELKGKNPRVFSSGEKSNEEYMILWETILSGQEWRGELHNKKKNGELFWEFVSISAIRNKMGHITHFLAVKEDITDRKQAEKDLQELEIARNTARFKQNFLANMSHEIRTPLTGVLGMLDILELTHLSDDQKDYVDTIKVSGENLKEIINQVLDYSKIEAGKIKLKPLDFEFQSILQNAEMLYRNITRPGVRVFTQLDPAIPRFIITDKNRLSQVLNNLVSNALKYTHEGSVSIQARLLAKLTEKQVHIEIRVVDTGIGIPAHLQQKLFIPFSQIDDNDTRYYEGTGLGLSICKELVGMLGGEIGVVSNHTGSSFWFTFKAEIAEYQHEPEPFPHQYINHQSLHILLTEDKVVNQKVISLMLKSMGHTVTIANNGEKALELFESGKYDLILMDIQMPVMNGITATQILKERFTQLPPIIGLSANAFEGDREKYMALGMDEYLSKPMKGEDFQKVVHHFFSKSM